MIDRFHPFLKMRLGVFTFFEQRKALSLSLSAFDSIRSFFSKISDLSQIFIVSLENLV